MATNDLPGPTANSKNKVGHVLVIRLSALGDVAMTVPVLLALTQKYPHLRITMLTKAFCSPIFHQVKNVSVYLVDVKGRHKGFWGLWRLYRELSVLQLNAIADLHNVLRSQILRLFFSINKIPIGKINKGRAEKKALTMYRDKVFEPLKSTHERYAEVFSKLGYPIDLENAPLLEKENLSASITELIGKDGKQFVGIAPFAAYEGKRYPLYLMEKVISALNTIDTIKILLFGGGKKEKEQLAIWSEKFGQVINIAGHLTFTEELALISNLEVMVSMDSANGHLAAMYGVSVISLWGVTHPYAGFAPFGQATENALVSDRNKFPFIPTSVYGNTFPPGYDKAMETILPEKVIQKIVAILSKK